MLSLANVWNNGELFYCSISVDYVQCITNQEKRLIMRSGRKEENQIGENVCEIVFRFGSEYNIIKVQNTMDIIQIFESV